MLLDRRCSSVEEALKLDARLLPLLLKSLCFRRLIRDVTRTEELEKRGGEE